jgi:tryptophan 2,3-dioxygenase
MQSYQTDEKSAQMIDRLTNKLNKTGQSLSCHLEGLLHTNYQTYWNYIQLDVLLQLQQTRTGFPDEKIFITYHQITELYFKLIIAELELLSCEALPEPDIYILRVNRVNRYLENLIFSFDIMIEGLDNDQFMVFRTALAPASGFQSVQYRFIELYTTELNNLVDKEKRPEAGRMNCTQKFSNLYWKKGAIDKTTGKKDASLINFEKVYDRLLLTTARNCRFKNLAFKRQMFAENTPRIHELDTALRRFDYLMNVEWRLAHFRSAAKHLRGKNREAVKATGGTNWQTYLPPRFQTIIFFPYLWSAEERENWGRSFIEHHITGTADTTAANPPAPRSCWFTTAAKKTGQQEVVS